MRRPLLRNKQGIFRPQFHTAKQVLCVKMCEFNEKVLKTHVSLDVNIFTLSLKVDINTFLCFGAFLRLSPLMH